MSMSLRVPMSGRGNLSFNLKTAQAGATMLVAPKCFGSIEGRLNQLKSYVHVIASSDVGTGQSFSSPIHHKLFLFLHYF